MPARDGKYSIDDADQPTPAERRALVQRFDGLDAALAPGAPNRIAIAALRLFDGWPQIKMDETKAADTGLAYAAQIEGFPVWAIERAVKVCQGRNSPWPPSSGQFRAAVAEQVTSYRLEMAKIDKILSAEVHHRLTAEEKERSRAEIGEMLKGLGCSMRMSGAKRQHSPDPGLTKSER